MESLKNKVERIRTEILNTPRLEQLLEDMDSAITPVLLILYEKMNHLKLNTGSVGAGYNSGTSEIAALEN